ncbi:MAG: bifunctional UDP-N-acetylglucosamine diphosphorylase/glucosamine-1-phosphate N-acetyltransferase GlmU [Pseudomonadota bacterium]|nr:bifunctional UDP-N-acetylglucosamine diphosphorylase/glucosamine-1-phosphate N-acetyltransferase GlmU [Pseudomonadota bacterium]
MHLSVVVLAAGKGKRMVSDLPKVLHQVGGKALLAHVLDTVATLDAAACQVVYGHGGEMVRQALAGRGGVAWIEQAPLLGTGHAVAQALPQVADDAVVLVLYGDVPLVRRETLQPLVDSARRGGLGLLTVVLDDPTGYGRILRDAAGRVTRIVEEKDATPVQRAVREVNTGILAAPAARLRAWVAALGNANAQGEYYLTDVVAMAVAGGVAVEAYAAAAAWEVQGVNDRAQLAMLERHWQQRQAAALMAGGATLLDPARVDVRGAVTTGRDVVIDINVIFEGEVRLGDRVRVGPHCVLRDAVLGADTEVLAMSHLEGVVVGEGVHIGPFARLRPGTALAAGVRVGNFVEVKKAVIGEGSKVNHLTYVGDAEIGRGVNVGAGTITCNYDGANKHRTIIEDNAFIGSNTALVAPVRVGRNATVGAGSAIGRDVPPDSLALTRAPQKTLPHWQRPVKAGRKP